MWARGQERRGLRKDTEKMWKKKEKGESKERLRGRKERERRFK